MNNTPAHIYYKIVYNLLIKKINYLTLYLNNLLLFLFVLLLFRNRCIF